MKYSLMLLAVLLLSRAAYTAEPAAFCAKKIVTREGVTDSDE
jgi:hypothetical protein